jgi:MFS family permease
MSLVRFSDASLYHGPSILLTMNDLPPEGANRKQRWLPGRNLIALSLVSFLTDASSEIIAPLLPLFLVGTLGASVALVGIIEGAAESVASLLKLASGWWSDRAAGRRKPLIVGGYALSSLMRPMMAMVTTPAQALAVRLADRTGKGIRAAPRDGLLAASIAPEFRGRAFGFHRASDHAGAVVGPLIAMFCLRQLGMPLRDVFWVAAIPGALAVLVTIFGVREVAARVPQAGPQPAQLVEKASAELAKHTSLGVPFKRTMLAIALFTLGNSTDAFLLLRAGQLGVTVANIPLLWLMLHVVKMVSSTPGGMLSDRFGRRPLIAGGWTVYAIVYAGFAFATSQWHVWALFAVYGTMFGLTEGTEKALVADLVPAHRRGAAFGWYHATIGAAALPASLLFGVVWEQYGARAAFVTGSTLAVLATIAFLATVNADPFVE